MSETQPDATAPASAPAPRFEDKLRELEEILKRLERGDLTLDDSVVEYERGIKVLRACREVLAGAERRIEELVRVREDGQGGAKAELQAFEGDSRPGGPPAGS